MHTRWFLVALALIGAALACNLDPFSSRDPRPTDVESVAVTPASGSGSFTLKVAIYSRPSSDDTVSCYYVTPGGATMAIGLVFPSGMGAQTDTLAFNVSEPGDYTATCENDSATSKKSAQFTVIGATPTVTATPTITPIIVPTETPSPTQPPPVTLKWRITFDFAQVQSSIPGAGVEMFYVTNPCIPEITIGADGSLSGACEKIDAHVHTTTSGITAQVTGQVDASGNITFTYEVSEIGTAMFSDDRNPTWRISYWGQGKFASGTQASGTATFHFLCDSGSPQLFWCDPDTTFSEFDGTIPWSFAPAQ